jgi:hypothetical protein
MIMAPPKMEGFLEFMFRLSVIQCGVAVLRQFQANRAIAARLIGCTSVNPIRPPVSSAGKNYTNTNALINAVGLNEK